MFKTETHLHTADVSKCGQIKAEKMMQMYHDAGYKTVFVSDHFQGNVMDPLGDIPWTEKVTIFLSGYYRAKVAGEKLGMNVLPCAEITFAGAPNHYLAYGITKAFLDGYPDLNKMTIAEFYPIAKAHNIFLVQAHPYRDGSCTPTPEFADAMEVYNSNPRHADYSDRSEACAREHGLPVTAGSDAHRLEDVALSGILTEKEIKTPEDYIEAVKSGKLQFIKEEKV